MNHVGIKEIWQADDRTFSIAWTDNQVTQHDVVRLREFCPCADCVNEHTGERKPQAIDPKIRRPLGRFCGPTESKSVGQTPHSELTPDARFGEHRRRFVLDFTDDAREFEDA